MLIERIWLETDRLILRLDRLRFEVAASYLRYSLEGSRAYPATQEARAGAILYSMAELESLTRFLIVELNTEINGLGLLLSQANPGLRRLAAHEWFESLRALQDSGKVWERRAQVTTMDTSRDILKLPVSGRPKSQPPLDGKTLRPEHFGRLWETYGFAAEPFPTGSWQTTLRKLSGLRNDLAHGNVPFDEVFKTAGLRETDIHAYLNDVSHLSLHLASTWELYLKGASYQVS